MPDDEVPKDPLGHIPRYVLFRGRKARVIGYENGKFLILDHEDAERLVPRQRLTFLKTSRQ